MGILNPHLLLFLGILALKHISLTSMISSLIVALRVRICNLFDMEIKQARAELGKAQGLA